MQNAEERQWKRRVPRVMIKETRNCKYLGWSETEGRELSMYNILRKRGYCSGKSQGTKKGQCGGNTEKSNSKWRRWNWQWSSVSHLGTLSGRLASLVDVCIVSSSAWGPGPPLAICPAPVCVWCCCCCCCSSSSSSTSSLPGFSFPRPSLSLSLSSPRMSSTYFENKGACVRCCFKHWTGRGHGIYVSLQPQKKPLSTHSFVLSLHINISECI